uniref:Uncharacterized protein n=1 Tax=Tetranychus urticae TaxID=32264 RepID=T1L0V2_TETUR
MTAMNGFGHLNACIGIGSLIKRGHQVYFAFNDAYKETIEKYGFHYISFREYNDKNYSLINGLPLEALKESMKPDSSDKDSSNFLFEVAKGENCAMLNILEEMKPDICLADYLWFMPWMAKASCPVVSYYVVITTRSL